MNNSISEWHKRLNNFESFDEIRLYVVPRFKTSGLSGDEWRQHVQIDFLFKGEKVAESSFNSMQNAIGILYYEWIKHKEPIPERVIEMERNGKCDQPSCKNDAIGRYWILKEFSDRGEKLHNDEQEHHRSYRQFCDKHKHRGDCSLEDSDDNYREEGVK